MKNKIITSALVSLTSIIACTSFAENKIADHQTKWVEFYKKQKNIVAPEQAQLNTEKEPDLSSGFTSLYNGKNLKGWTPRGGFSTFEAKGEYIEGVAVKKSPSTYLSTDKRDYKNFIFTIEMKWLEDGNTGVIVRGNTKPPKDGKKYETVYGPQAEMEDEKRKRFWSGGMYGQSYGGWHYPLWLEAHKDARGAINYDQWNRLTIKAVGNNYKTWVNGIPAANWTNNSDKNTFEQGFFSLQIHAGGKGKILFKNIKVKEL